MMNVTLLNSTDYLASQWSGGSTTQMAIEPAGAVYAERDFLWRLSSATVDLEAKTATVTGDVSDEVLRKTVEDAGYTVVSID